MNSCDLNNGTFRKRIVNVTKDYDYFVLFTLKPVLEIRKPAILSTFLIDISQKYNENLPC